MKIEYTSRVLNSSCTLASLREMLYTNINAQVQSSRNSDLIGLMVRVGQALTLFKSTSDHFHV